MSKKEYEFTYINTLLFRSDVMYGILNWCLLILIILQFAVLYYDVFTIKPEVKKKVQEITRNLW